MLVSAAQSFWGPTPSVLVTRFYCLKFEINTTWRVRSPYLYHPGTGWNSYTIRHWVPFPSPPTTRRATVEVFDPVSYVTTDDHSVSRPVGQSASLSWYKAPIWSVRPDYYYCVRTDIYGNLDSCVTASYIHSWKKHAWKTWLNVYIGAEGLLKLSYLHSRCSWVVS
jgi:hypothetical protein